MDILSHQERFQNQFVISSTQIAMKAIQQSSQIELFHQKFKMNKKMIKEWAGAIKKQKSSLLKIVNYQTPHSLRLNENCDYQNNMDMIIDQTREMVSQFLHQMNKYEVMLSKQHLLLKKEGKSIYQAQKDMKEEFKCQKEFYDQFFKKSQSKSQVSTQAILREDISNRLQRTNSQQSEIQESQMQKVEGMNNDLAKQQTLHFLSSSKLLLNRSSLMMMKSNKVCMQSGAYVSSFMTEFGFSKLEKHIGTAVMSLNSKRIKDLDEEITKSDISQNAQYYDDMRKAIPYKRWQQEEPIDLKSDESSSSKKKQEHHSFSNILKVESAQIAFPSHISSPFFKQEDQDQSLISISDSKSNNQMSTAQKNKRSASKISQEFSTPAQSETQTIRQSKKQQQKSVARFEENESVKSSAASYYNTEQQSVYFPNFESKDYSACLSSAKKNSKVQEKGGVAQIEQKDKKKQQAEQEKKVTVENKENMRFDENQKVKDSSSRKKSSHNVEEQIQKKRSEGQSQLRY